MTGIRMLQLFVAVLLSQIILAQQPASTRSSVIAPGVTLLVSGEAERFAPYQFCTDTPRLAAMRALPASQPPFDLGLISLAITDRGALIRLPLQKDEQLYGFGLQIGSFNQRGLRKRPIVNDNPLNDLGFTHAPQNFYVSNKGYGIIVNTSRYATFYCGTTARTIAPNLRDTAGTGGASVDELYANRATGSGGIVTVTITASTSA